MRFEFATAAQVVFGPGTLAESGKLARPWGRRALVVTGRTPRRAERLLRLLSEAGIEARVFPVDGEPTLSAVASAVSAARELGAQMVIGFGGGSAIDAAKAAAGLLANPGDIFDYLEVVGRGLPLPRPAAPWMAIPTTAGTGAEVTRNAVLGVPEKGVKVSWRSPHLLARVALVDPELTLELPPAVTAASGMDALTQLLEAYVSSRANPMTDALCAAGLPRAARAFPGYGATPGTWRRARSSRSRASGAASRWPTPASGPCTASRRQSAGSSPPRTAPSARSCLPRSCPQTWPPCAHAPRPAGPSAATTRSAAG